MTNTNTNFNVRAARMVHALNCGYVDYHEAYAELIQWGKDCADLAADLRGMYTRDW